MVLEVVFYVESSLGKRVELYRVTVPSVLERCLDPAGHCYWLRARQLVFAAVAALVVSAVVALAEPVVAVAKAFGGSAQQLLGKVWVPLEVAPA